MGVSRTSGFGRRDLYALVAIELETLRTGTRLSLPHTEVSFDVRCWFWRVTTAASRALGTPPIAALADRSAAPRPYNALSATRPSGSHPAHSKQFVANIQRSRGIPVP